MTPMQTTPSTNNAAIVDIKSRKTPQKSSQVAYWQSLPSIRESCERVYAEIKADNPAARFRIREERLESVCEFVASLILRDYKNPQSDIPPHGRWRHFLPAGSVEKLLIEPLRAAGTDKDEITTILLDLFTVSVLLDAGAGDKWQFTCRNGSRIGRSEGLAVASMEMFLSGVFSSTPESAPWRVDAQKLLSLSEEDLAQGLQVDPANNPLVGLPGRLDLLRSLGRVLMAKQQEYFCHCRPGNLLTYLQSVAQSDGRVEIEALWRVVIDGFGGVWPASRTQLDGVSLGDVWPTRLLAGDEKGFVAFHKLSQWLTYSLLEPLEQIAQLRFCGTEQMTGLAEYRNGGLFIDFGVLELKDAEVNGSKKTLAFPADSEEIVQWRACTVCLLDRLAPLLQRRLNLTAANFSLPKMLEGGTWKAGREIARKMRPDTAGPPINVISDGTLF